MPDLQSQSWPAKRRKAWPWIPVTLFIFVAAFSAVKCDDLEYSISFSVHDIAMELHDNSSFELYISNPPFNETLIFSLTSDRPGSVTIVPENITVYVNDSLDTQIPITKTIYIVGDDLGQMNVYLDEIYNNSNRYIYDTSNAYLRLKVKELYYLDTLDDVIGWLYFVAWSISFYPQIWINFRRKSVRGLNLDYVSFNVLGFFCYSVYNCGLYFNAEIQKEYASRHQYGVTQVAIQDVVFALHALFASLLTATEAIIFDRAGQKVSKVCICLVSAGELFLIICLVLACTNVIAWLDYLYYFSYVKLAITLIKYVPQAYFNFRRKSTKGWSIGNVILDFTGGTLSMLQMFVQAYNYDDWDSLFGDPTKFALGMFSVLFDILFMIQHYGLYRNQQPEYKSMSDTAAAVPSYPPPPYADLIRTSATIPSSNAGIDNPSWTGAEDDVAPAKAQSSDEPV